jgi:hypothetical protein
LWGPIIATFLVVAVMLFGPSTAAALAAMPADAGAVTQSHSGSLTVPIVGTNGTNAVATITGFVDQNGTLTAVGTITGVVDTAAGLVNVVNAPFSAPVTASGSCTILTLDIGAIHLDLLGLVVDLSPIHLSITAQSGSGQLLGNLLCAVAHLLDNASTNAIANLLDQILRAL